MDLRCEKHTSTMLEVQTLFSSPGQSQERCHFKQWLAPLQSQTRMLQVQTLSLVRLLSTFVEDAILNNGWLHCRVQHECLQVQTLFFSPGIWVVCSRPLKNDEQAVQHYYLKNDRQAVEHYQRTADAGRLSRTCHFNLARNS